MGHTTASMTERIRKERSFFNGFLRALLTKKDQLLFEELWDSIEIYIPSAEKSTHPLLIATILMAIILVQHKLIGNLQTQLEKLKHEVAANKTSKDKEIAHLNGEIERLENDLDTKLQAMKSDIFETIHPSYAS